MNNKISEIVNSLYASGIRFAMLDWDGCMTPTSTPAHGQLIAAALRQCKTFARLAKITPEQAQKAYNGPGHGVDWFELVMQNAVKPRIRKHHWFKCNQELKVQLPRLAEEFKLGRLKPKVSVVPQPGAKEFLIALQQVGIHAVVVTMTPTELAEGLAVRSGLRLFVDQIYGCEKFLIGKDNPALWLGVARKHGFCAENSMVVEDGVPGTVGASAAKVAGLLLLKQSRRNQVQSSYGGRLLVSATDGSFYTLN